MFSFRKDKMGFINGLILMSIVGATVIATVLLWAVWGWDQCGTAIKIIWGTAWVLCIVAVVVRVRVYKHQRDKAARAAAPPEERSESES
jgi:hypothetical protein